MERSPNTPSTNVETWINQHSDSDAEWWPFAFLRPGQHQHFGTRRCMLLAVLYGLPATLFALVCGISGSEAVGARQLLVMALTVITTAFVLFRSTIAPAWNRRAHRLRGLLERRHAWHATAYGGSGRATDDSRSSLAP